MFTLRSLTPRQLMRLYRQYEISPAKRERIALTEFLSNNRYPPCDHMDRGDQQYALMAAAAAYAQKKARDEARRALIISAALNQNMSNLDPDTQEQLRALLAAESRRVNQENLEWKIGWWALGIIFGGLGLVFLLAIAH
jgi:DNA-directed RNA polymerase subunit F